MRLLKFELEKYAINWEAVEASTLAFEGVGAASSSSIEGFKKQNSHRQAAKKEMERARSLHAEGSSFKGKERSKDKRTGSRGRGSASAQDKRNGGDAREGRSSKRRRCADTGAAESEEIGSGAEKAPTEEHAPVPALAAAGGA